MSAATAACLEAEVYQARSTKGRMTGLKGGRRLR